MPGFQLAANVVGRDRTQFRFVSPGFTFSIRATRLARNGNSVPDLDRGANSATVLLPDVSPDEKEPRGAALILWNHSRGDRFDWCS